MLTLCKTRSEDQYATLDWENKALIANLIVELVGAMTRITIRILMELGSYFYGVSNINSFICYSFGSG